MSSACQRVRPLFTRRSRIRGLLGTDANAFAVVLVKCASVHTFGMRYPLDIAFLSSAGEVLRVMRNVAPGRIACCCRAHFVVERPHREGVWFRQGAHLVVELRERIVEEDR